MRTIISFLFSMKKLFPLLAPLVLLTACVDTTGISAETSRGAHPSTDSGASVTVTEYGDLQCPSCRGAQELIVKPLIAKYGKQISFEFSHFPLQALHPYAMMAAEASECAADQGKFWEFVDLDFTNQTSLSPKSIIDWATQLKLDMDLFDRCTRSHIKRPTIQAEYDAGRALGVGGTPTFFVNGKRVESDLNAISAAIDEAKKGIGTRL